jgi:hypothetical protein
MKALAIFCTVLTLAFTASTASAQVTTSQYDNLRSGATLTETVLAPQNVNAKQFGKLGAFKVDGAVYAQPLFVPSVDIPARAPTTASTSPPRTIASMPSTPIALAIRLCGT